MLLRILQLGRVSALQSQAIYHGVAEALKPSDHPILILCKPDQPYVCIGMHQDLSADVDTVFCQRNQIPIIRRQLGGGTVLLDQNQLFFQFVFPRQLAPKTVDTLYPYFIQPIVATYNALGIKACFKAANDIQVYNRKIGGTGAATIGQATVLGGSFLFDFDFDLMSQIITSPSQPYRDFFRQHLLQQMTTVKGELGFIPEENLILNTLYQALEKSFNATISFSQLTELESEKIIEASNELSDDEWTYIDGKKPVEHGIKLAANCYLTEVVFSFSSNNASCILLQKDRTIIDCAFVGDSLQLLSLPRQLIGCELNFEAVLAKINLANLTLTDPEKNELCSAILKGVPQHDV